jgi:response regulator RpfG family c-di-GMP phosphodiesterase
LGKHVILILTADMKRLSFMSMYEKNFVLRWVSSIASAEQLARQERFEFALVNFDPDPQRAIEFCERLKKVQPETRIIFLKSDYTPLPDNFCADIVLEPSLSEHELAAYLQNYLKQYA